MSSTSGLLLIGLLSLYNWHFVYTKGLPYASDHMRKCKPIPIKIEECKHLVYNYTGMPNLLMQETQIDAQNQLQTFQPLILYHCSPKLKFFLCSVFIPMCDPNTNYLIGPCRPLCEEVRDNCQGIMSTFNLPWPAHLNCSQFPSRNAEGSMCMEGPKTKKYVSNRRKGFCHQMKQPQSYVYINRTLSCVPKCKVDILFARQDKYIARVWLAVLASMCFVSCIFTIATFLIDTDRFRYPERPVIFMSVCYCVYSIAHFVRLLHSRAAASCNRDPVSDQLILTQEGLDNTVCAIIFLPNYFFWLASNLWWVVLTLGWLLAAGLQWTEQAILQRSAFYHLAVWLVASLLTVAVLVLRCVDADELLGMCSVGQQSRSALLAFVILPNFIFLSLGSVFLLAGLVALVRVRRQVKQDGLLKTEKLEILMVRIGLFSVLFFIPSAIVLGCNIHEYLNRNRWLQTGVRPNVELFMLKIFMSSVVGITSGVWVWSFKTLDSWRWFLCRRRRAGQQPPSQQQHQQQRGTNSTLVTTTTGSCGPKRAKRGGNMEIEMVTNSVATGAGSTGWHLLHNGPQTGQLGAVQDFSSSGYTHPHSGSNCGDVNL